MYRATIRTATDPATAFDYASRFDHAAQWDPSVSHAEMLTADSLGKGSRFRLVTRFAGRQIVLDYEIIEFEPSERVVLRADTQWVRSTDTITFSPDGAGTVVQYDALLETKGLARLADPFIAFAFRRLGDRAVGGLRAHLNTVEPA